ncbi:MAG: HAD-IA family hydrolase [Planctomycetota bacterium]
MSCDLLLLDCDGVIVDSEPPSTRVLAECIRELGYEISQERVIRELMGIRLPDMADAVSSLIGRPVPEGFLEGFREKRRRVFETEIRPMRGIVELLDAVDRAGLPYCCVTNGPPEKAAQTLRVAGLAERFAEKNGLPRLASAYDLGVFKPDPGPYLWAAERYGIAPERCVVVEDTPIGATAGVAAGMRTLGYADLLPPERFEAVGAEVIGGLGEVIATLELI